MRKTRVILNQKKKKRISNKVLSNILIVCSFINILLVSTVLVPAYSSLKEKQETVEIIEEATILVELKENRIVSFYSKAKISDFIVNINGKIKEDRYIDTKKIGKRHIAFEYVNDDGITIPYTFDVTVIDDVKPDIWLSGTKTITTDYKGNLLEDITCADNYDDNPKCEIIGKYNTKKVGKYKLTFKATDASGNTTTKNFTLNVKEPVEKKPSTNTSTPSQKNYIEDIIKTHKTSNTKIGIDVSSWQGDIDFEKVKKAGVEFVIIRVGSKRGIDGEYFVDKKFKRNIEGFNKVGMPVGIYFYSYANSQEAAIRDAKWVLNEIKDYKVDLPIAYDWESWSFYNEFNQSFYSLSMSAKAFLDTVSDAGYEGLLYSSKNYLQKVWFDIGYDVWMAHYTSKTSYEGPYKYWQLCSNGRVDGIKGNVDVNIMYN